MTDEETIALLIWAALYDPRLKRVDDNEATDRALAWHELLVDVEYSDAQAAVKAHYALSKEAIMPADILERVGVVEDPWAHIPDVDAELAPLRRARALEAAGVTEEEFAKNWRDRQWRAEHFPDESAAPGWPKQIEGKDEWL